MSQSRFAFWERPFMALSGLFERPCRTSAIGGKGDIPTMIQLMPLAPEVIGTVRTLNKLQEALKRAGIEFIPAEGGKGPGVRLSHEEGGPQERRRK
jgi:hypothetical protein